MQYLYAQLTRVFISFLYTYIYQQCCGMQGLCDQLSRGVCKASMLN